MKLKVVCLLLCLVSVISCRHVICRNNYGVTVIGCQSLVYKTSKTCPDYRTRYKSLVPCARVCRPRDCLFLSQFDKESFNHTSSSGIAAKKIDCVAQVAKRSLQLGCYNKTRFDRTSQQIVDKFVNGNTSRIDLETEVRKEYVIGEKGVVAIPALLNHYRFSLCFDFNVSIPFKTEKLTDLISFNITAEGWDSFELFRIVCHTYQIRFMGVYDGYVVFRTPFEIRPGDKMSVCVSYASGPPVRLTAWIRSDSQPLVKLQPSRILPVRSYSDDIILDYLLGALIVGEPDRRFTDFQGSIGRIRLLRGYLSTKREALSAIRGEAMMMDVMTGSLAGASEMSRWTNNSHNLKVWTETEITGDVTTVLTPRYGDLCLSCKSRCLSVNSTCEFLRGCASCEEMYCTESKHYQGSYESTSCSVPEPLHKCNATSLALCFEPFKKRFTRCEDVNVMIECVQQIDLDSCSWYMFDRKHIYHLNGNPYTRCTQYRWTFLHDLVEPRMSVCGEACVVDSGLIELGVTPIHRSPYRVLKMNDNRELCEAVNSYRSCVVENSCAEQDFSDVDMGPACSRYSWIYPTIKRLHRVQKNGCLVPRECKILLNSTHGQATLKNVEFYEDIDGYPKNDKQIAEFNAWMTRVAVPTRKELKKCRQRAAGKANATLILTPNQVKNNRKKRPRRSMRIVHRNGTVVPRGSFKFQHIDIHF